MKKIQLMFLLSTALLCGKGVANAQQKQTVKKDNKIALTLEQWNKEKLFLTKFKPNENKFIYNLDKRDTFFKDLFEKDGNQAICLGEGHDWAEELLLVDNNGVHKNDFFKFAKDSLNVNYLLVELPGDQVMSELARKSIDDLNKPVFTKVDSVMQDYIKKPTEEGKQYIQEAVLNYKQSDLDVFNIFQLANHPERYGLEKEHYQAARDAVTYIESLRKTRASATGIEVMNNILDAGITVIPIDDHSQKAEKTKTIADREQWRNHDVNYDWFDLVKETYPEIFDNNERFIVLNGGGHIGGQNLKTTDEIAPFTNVLRENGVKCVGIKLKVNLQDRSQDFTAEDLAKDLNEQDVENGEYYGIFESNERTHKDYTILVPSGSFFEKNPVSKKRQELNAKYKDVLKY